MFMHSSFFILNEKIIFFSFNFIIYIYGDRKHLPKIHFT